MRKVPNLYVDFWVRLGSFLAPLIPFYLPAIVERSLDKSSTSILDLGGGTGIPMKGIDRNKKFWTVNCDVSLLNLKEAKRRTSHDEFILTDIRNLPFKEKSFDITLALSVLEHLPKEDGLKLLKDLDTICCNEIIIAVPCNAAIHPSPDLKNPYQAHISRWKPADLQDLGFKVRRWGPHRICGESLHHHLLSKPIFRPIGQMYALLTALLSLFFPRIGGEVIALKILRDGACLCEFSTHGVLRAGIVVAKQLSAWRKTE